MQDAGMVFKSYDRDGDDMLSTIFGEGTSNATINNVKKTKSKGSTQINITNLRLVAYHIEEARAKLVHPHGKPLDNKS